MLVSAGPRIDAVLEGYRQLMRALHAERARRGTDPWNQCPLTMPQLRALSLIAASHSGLSSRELAETLSVGASAITPLVDRLVERGFARRHDDPHDRRIARLEATESATALLEHMASGQGDVVRDILGRLNADELAIVAAALDVLQAGLSRTTQPPYEPPMTPKGTTA